MSMKRYTMIAAALTLCCNLFAQKDSLDAIIQVENDYNPVVMKANKQSFTPQIEMPAETKPLDLIFSQGATPYGTFTSNRNIKEILPKQESTLPGYVRLGYGNNNNVDAMAAYRFNPSYNNTLDLIASFNGFSTGIDAYESEWDSRLFTTWMGAEYTHHFDHLDLGVEATLNKKVFNYRESAFAGGLTDKQNSGRYKIMMKALSKNSGPLSYKANLGFTTSSRKYAAGEEDKTTENRITVGGKVAYELPNDDIQNIGVEAVIDGFIYNSALKPEMNEYENYISIRINPFMNFRFDDWKLRLGVHTDMLTANGSFFAFAPDCSLEGPIAEGIRLIAKATGGRTLNTFSSIEEMSPYWCYIPGSEQYTATYKVFDLMAGLNITAEPLLINLHTGYAYTKDDMFASVSDASVIHTTFTQGGSHNVYLGGRIDYDCGGWLKLTANVRYDKWSNSGSDNLLMYKPQITAGLNCDARIYDGLYATIGYKFVNYTKGEEENIENMNNLEAKLSYKFNKQIGAFVTGSNLLGSEYEAYPGYLIQGTNFLIGANISF